MKKRVVAVDVLRASAIIGMVFCASIGWNSDLPAWMFHAQVPPPDYIFNPAIPGITWVDLVFPFFIFSMGVAVPFSMRRQLEKGASDIDLFKGLLHRWLSLSIFALLLGNFSMVGSSLQPAWQIRLFKVSVWIGFFLTFVRLRQGSPKTGRMVNLAGLVLLLVAALAEWFHFGVRLSIHSSDIIILVLANLSLWGGLIWMLTRSLSWGSLWIFILCAVLKGIADHAPEFLAWVPELHAISWLFRWDFLQYLVIFLPATFVGDMILRFLKEEPESAGWRGYSAALILPALVIFQLWGLYSRHIAADLAGTLLIAGLFLLLVMRIRKLWVYVARIGLVFLVAGILMDPVDGGIAKDPCNLSYLLTTCGCAMSVISSLLFLESEGKLSCGMLARTGQNPMLAYTLSGYLICPLLYLSGALGPFDLLTVGSPFFGILRGILITGIMVVLTSGFSSRRIFWRS